MTHEEQNTKRREAAWWSALIPRVAEVAFYLVISISVGVIIVWWNEGPPMVVVERFLMTPQVKPGESIRIQNIVVATKRCPVMITRTIVDAYGVQYTIVPETIWPEERLGQFIYTSETNIPSAAAEGPANYRVKAQWVCNPLQRFFPPEIRFSDVEVEVTK